MASRRLVLVCLSLLLAVAVPTQAVDLECVLGGADCCRCQVSGEADECSAPAMTARAPSAPAADLASPVVSVAPPPRPVFPEATLSGPPTPRECGLLSPSHGRRAPPA